MTNTEITQAHRKVADARHRLEVARDDLRTAEDELLDVQLKDEISGRVVAETTHDQDHTQPDRTS